jgi:hypothetical protein
MTQTWPRGTAPSIGASLTASRPRHDPSLAPPRSAWQSRES